MEKAMLNETYKKRDETIKATSWMMLIKMLRLFSENNEKNQTD